MADEGKYETSNENKLSNERAAKISYSRGVTKRGGENSRGKKKDS